MDREPYLKSLADIKLRQPEPPHRVDIRLQLADMVLNELPGNDIEELVWRAYAQALRDVYLTDHPQRHERYENAVRSLDVVMHKARRVAFSCGKYGRQSHFRPFPRFTPQWRPAEHKFCFREEGVRCLL
jgi:hypothetical protein